MKKKTIKNEMKTEMETETQLEKNNSQTPQTTKVKP